MSNIKYKHSSYYANLMASKYNKKVAIKYNSTSVTLPKGYGIHLHTMNYYNIIPTVADYSIEFEPGEVRMFDVILNGQHKIKYEYKFKTLKHYNNEKISGYYWYA